MSHLSEIYFKLDTLETIVKTLKARNMPGVSITISTNDEVKSFPRPDGSASLQNISAYVSQTKEQREAKAQRFYVANGKVFWSDGKPPVVPGAQPAQAPAPDPIAKYEGENTDGLPF